MIKNGKVNLMNFKDNKERKPRQEACKTSFNLLYKYYLILEFRYDAMLFSQVGNEKSDADNIIWSHRKHLALGPHVHDP